MVSHQLGNESVFRLRSWNIILSVLNISKCCFRAYVDTDTCNIITLSIVELQHLEMEARAKRASLDRISNIPLTIIENILCLVPIKDAVRTSILSKKWRYNWVKIPKLVFNENDMFDKTASGRRSILERSFDIWPSERKNLTRKCKLFYAIHQVLLVHHGPILEFSLSMIDADFTCVEIDQIIIHLAKNSSVRKLTLDSEHQSDHCLFRLPSSIISLHQLTDLHVKSCSFDRTPTFSGFSSLTSLYFQCGYVSKNSLLHLLSNCPLLKRLDLVLSLEGVDEEIPIIELFKCLPLIEHLFIFRFLAVIEFDSLTSELPNALVHLKSFCVHRMMLLDDHGLRILGLVMRVSPNLEKLRIGIIDICNDDDEVKFITLEECSDIWLENLKELEIVNFLNIEGEMEFVEFILARSPALEMVSIMLDTPHPVTKDAELEILRTLLLYPRVSPSAKISVESGNHGTHNLLDTP